jgi:NAD+ kinase
VATPTGSTAYSLSAGGSIVLPETDVMLITPVAAHNLYSRPLVVSADSEIHISFSSVSPTAKMAFDGQQFYDVMNDDEVIIRKYRHSAVFVWPEQGMFFKKLKAKLMSS